MWIGGGEGTDHSSVPTCQGLVSARGPRKSAWKKFQMKTSCPAKSTKAAQLVYRFSGRSAWMY